MEKINDTINTNIENNLDGEKQIKQNVVNNITNNLIFTSETNNIINLDHEIQASFLKYLMENIVLIKQSFSIYKKITEEMKFKSFEKYLKYFDINANTKKLELKNKKRVNLIKLLYKNLYNEKKTIKLNNNLPDNMIMDINMQTIYETSENILIALNSLFAAKNCDEKLIKLINGKLNWKEACIKSKYKDYEFNKFEKTMKYLETLSCFSCFNLQILKDINEEQNIQIEYILLFYIFLEPIFKDAIKININISMPNLDKNYIENYIIKKNLYQMDIKLIKTQKTFLDGFLVNFILLEKICNHFKDRENPILTYEQYDSYIIEIGNLFRNELIIPISENIKEVNYNLLYYDTLFSLKAKTGFKVRLNALDSLLFQNIIFSIFIILSTGESIQEIEIILFPEDCENNKINYRKLLLNCLYYKERSNKDIPVEYRENFLDFSFNKKFNWKNQYKNSIISVSEDKILDLLFEDFNKNLVYLVVALEKNYLTLKEKIIINLPSELIIKKKFVYSVAQFIYNVFNILYRKCLSINMSELKLATNIIIPENLSKFEKICLRDLQINNIKLKINKISYILDLSSLPFNSVDLISLSNISDMDLTYLISALRNIKNTQTKIKHLKLKFGYSLYNNNIFSLIDDMLRNYALPRSIYYLTMRFKNELGFNDYTNLMWKIINSVAISEDNPKELKISVKIYYDSQESENVPYKEIKQALSSCFDFEKLNENFIMIYNFSITKINKGNLNKEILVEINKYRRSFGLDTFIKLSNGADKYHKMQIKYAMTTCLRIIRFISIFKPESNIKIYFSFIKS